VNRRNTTILALLGLATLAILGTIYMLNRSPTAPAAAVIPGKGADFSFSSCASGSTAGLRSAEWDKVGLLHVRYSIAAACSSPIKYGGYGLSEGNLILAYSIEWPPGVEAARCTCAYELDYRIRGLEKKAYTITSMQVSPGELVPMNLPKEVADREVAYAKSRAAREERQRLKAAAEGKSEGEAQAR
jgi:hypothetical protein